MQDITPNVTIDEGDIADETYMFRPSALRPPIEREVDFSMIEEIPDESMQFDHLCTERKPYLQNETTIEIEDEVENRHLNDQNSKYISMEQLKSQLTNSIKHRSNKID